MEAKIYFTIKLVCAVFIFRQLWIFIFNREMYGIWEKAYRLMRIVRINLWKYRKKRSEQKAREANKKARRREKTDAHNRMTKKAVTEHVENIRGLDDAGKLEICGVFKGYPGMAGMYILKTDSREEAEALCEQEPLVIQGYATYQLVTLQIADRENNYLL